MGSCTMRHRRLHLPPRITTQPDLSWFSLSLSDVQEVYDLIPPDQDVALPIL